MPEQQQSGQDSSLDFLWVVGSIIVAVFLIWYFGKTHISYAVLNLRFYEILAIDFIFKILNQALQFLGLPQQFSATNLTALSVFVQKNIYGVGIDFSTLTQLSAVVGQYIRYPLTFLMLVAAMILYFGGVSHKFHHVFDTQSLKNLEQENWPQIKPVVKLDLIKKQLDEGPWAMALSPVNFCKKNNLIDVEMKNGKYIATLRRGVAYRLLSLQLGPKWRGAEVLPDHLKALFAIFAARINDDKKSAESLTDQISISSSGSKINFSGAENLMHKHIYTPNVTKIVNLHGYVTTVLASMLVSTRTTGVLASADFIWLKPIDRRMWYILNSVGRPTAVAEVSGIFAHWLAEKKLGLPLIVPMVDEAVNGLELALSEIIYKPDEEA